VTAYAVPFYFEENAHLNAIAKTAAGVETVVTLTNVTGAGDPNGGTVRTAVAVPATSTLTIYREVPATQTTSYAENDSFPAASHERALDKLTLLAQQALRKSGAGIRVTESSTQPQPAPSVPNSVAGLDENGNSIFRTPQELVEFLPDTFTVAALPTQTGNAGKLLATNGSTASWTNEPSFKSARITDGVYPYAQLTNTGAPTDKKRLRAYVDTIGNTGLARVNDAEAVSTNLLSWDVANTANFSFPVAITTANATLATFSGSPGPGGFTGIRVQCADVSAAAVKIAFFDFANETGTNVASLWTGFETDGSTNLRLLTTPAGSRSGDRRVERVRFTGDGNVGIGTTNTPERLTVAGNLRLLRAASADAGILFTDGDGTTPYLVSQADSNFCFYGTTAAGAQRLVWNCAMRSDTSALQVNVPLKIGAAGVAFQSVLKATVSHTIGTLAAGAFLELTSTVTGAIAGAMVHVGDGSPFNLIVRGYVANGNLVSVMYHNPTGSSINAGTRSIDLFVFNAI
jgi:hypothetical protein